MPSFLAWIQSKYNDLCQGNHQKSIKYTSIVYLQSFTKKNLLKKSSEIEFSLGDFLTIKEKPLSKDFE